MLHLHVPWSVHCMCLVHQSSNKFSCTVFWETYALYYFFLTQKGKYGIPAPWYFPFKLSFWADLCCCVQSKSSVGKGRLFDNIMQKNQPVFSEDKGKGIGKKKHCISRKVMHSLSWSVFFPTTLTSHCVYISPHSLLSPCTFLVWFTVYFYLCISLRREQSVLQGWRGFVHAPSGRCTSWTHQGLWWPGSHSEPKYLLLWGPRHLTAWPQWSWQDHHHVCGAQFFFSSLLQLDQHVPTVIWMHCDHYILYAHTFKIGFLHPFNHFSGLLLTKTLFCSNLAQQMHRVGD